MGGVDKVLSHVLKRWTLIIFGLGVVLAPPPPPPHLASFLSPLELSSFPDFSLSPLELWGPSQEP